MKPPTKILYGELAQQVTVTLPDGETHQQWFCSGCRRIWGHRETDNHAASYCCCTHRICGCGNEYAKAWTMCDTCREKKSSERWFAKPEVMWNGEFPLFDHASDEYFFDSDSIIEHIAERRSVHESDLESIAESLRLSSCHECKPREFDVTEWCCDELPEDGEIANAKSIDERINAILSEVGRVSFYCNSDRLNVLDVLQQIGFRMEDLE